jgi:hypothetical protein
MSITQSEARIRTDQEGATAVGWVALAGIVLLLLALLNAVEGIAAISGSQVFGRGDMIIGDLQTWGWVLCAIAAVQLVAAPWLWMGTSPAYIAGVGSAGVNAMVQLLFIPAYPFWSLAIFALDVLVIFALTVGRKQG